MYQNVHIDRRSDTVFVWDDKEGLKTWPLSSFRYAYKEKSGGRFKSVYGQELEKLVNFDERDPSLFESDVPLETRVLVDLYQDSDEMSEGHRVAITDIEVSSVGGFPNVEEADKEITAISLYDQLGKKYYVMVLDPDDKISDAHIELKPKNNAEVEIFGFRDESSLLLKFLNLWEEIAPTIVTGWNSNGFDLPYLYTRIKRELGYKNAKRLSPIGVAYISQWNHSMVIAGVSCLDYMDMFKLFPVRKEPSYTLAYIGKKFTGIDKVHYKGNLNDLYRDNLAKFIEYNFTDVQIVAELDEKKKFIDLARSLCHVGHVPYECFDSSSRYIEGAILVYLRRNSGEIVQNKSATGREEYELQVEENEEGFSGAYVKNPVPGKYDYVYDLDLTSMYPSIIISLNISPETKIGKISKVVYLTDEIKDQRRRELVLEARQNEKLLGEDQSPEDYAESKIDEFNIEYHIRDKYVVYEIGSTSYTNDEFRKLLSESKYSLSSNGVVYRQDKKGIIPTILVEWFNLRKSLRKKAKEAIESGDKALYQYYDQRQYTIKILLNSVYGVLGLAVFRFYDKDNAEAVTTTGVTIIKTAAAAINEYYKMALEVDEGDWVIASDTDSCFVSALPIIKKRNPEINLNDDEKMSEATLKITSEVQTFVNKLFDLMSKHYFNLETHRFDVKQELISKRSFWLAKKRYAQLIINKEGRMLSEPELDVKGIDVVRTSFPAKYRTFMEGFLRSLLLGATQKELDSSIMDFKTHMKEFDVEDLAKNTSVKFVSRDGRHDYNPKSRKLFHFEKGSPAQVKAALYYNDLLKHLKIEKQYEPIHHGQKIKWVYLKKNQFGIECIALKADGTDPDEVMSFITQYIDRNALYDKELKSKLEDFYGVLKWHYPTESSVKASEFFDF